MVIIGNNITIFHPLSQQIKKKSAIFVSREKIGLTHEKYTKRFSLS